MEPRRSCSEVPRPDRISRASISEIPRFSPGQGRSPFLSCSQPLPGCSAYGGAYTAPRVRRERHAVDDESRSLLACVWLLVRPEGTAARWVDALLMLALAFRLGPTLELSRALNRPKLIVNVSYWMIWHVMLTHGNQKRRKSSGGFGSNHEVARRFEPGRFYCSKALH